MQSSSPKRGLKIRYYIFYVWVNGYVTAQCIDDIEKVMSFKTIWLHLKMGNIWGGGGEAHLSLREGVKNPQRGGSIDFATFGQD